MEHELNDIERLTLAQALYKMAGELVDTKNPDSLRSMVDESFLRLYEETGSRTFDVKLNGEVVGTYSLRFSKPKESEARYSFEVDDYEALAKWYEGVPVETILHYVALDLNQFAEWYLADTGELPEGCVMEKVVTPAIGKTYQGGTLKIDVEKVKEAVSGFLPSRYVFGLLGGVDGS